MRIISSLSIYATKALVLTLDYDSGPLCQAWQLVWASTGSARAGWTGASRMHVAHTTIFKHVLSYCFLSALGQD